MAHSAYYAWVTRTAQGAAERYREESGWPRDPPHPHPFPWVYGAPRVHAKRGGAGWGDHHKRVERLMRVHEIVGYRPRRRRSLTKPDAGTAPASDLLGRLFDPERPALWAGRTLARIH